MWTGRTEFTPQLNHRPWNEKKRKHFITVHKCTDLVTHIHLSIYPWNILLPGICPYIASNIHPDCFRWHFYDTPPAFHHWDFVVIIMRMIGWHGMGWDGIEWIGGVLFFHEYLFEIAWTLMKRCVKIRGEIGFSTSTTLWVSCVTSLS